jgi:hypothetical protein
LVPCSIFNLNSRINHSSNCNDQRNVLSCLTDTGSLCWPGIFLKKHHSSISKPGSFININTRCFSLVSCNILSRSAKGFICTLHQRSWQLPKISDKARHFHRRSLVEHGISRLCHPFSSSSTRLTTISPSFKGFLRTFVREGHTTTCRRGLKIGGDGQPYPISWHRILRAAHQPTNKQN